jgi:hypothetical protein
MGTSSDQLNRQITEVRSSMESRVVALRQRGQRQVRRASRIALIALGVGAAVGVTAVGVYAVYRITRPPSTRERLLRLVPEGVHRRLLDVGKLRQSWELGLRRQIPAMRLYVGERQVGEKPPKPRIQQIAVSAAGAMGTAAGTALASTLVRKLASRAKEAA